ncbi:MAG: ice-binding family protein [Limisphaerales bacterium]
MISPIIPSILFKSVPSVICIALLSLLQPVVAAQQAPVNLGSASGFAVLAGSEITSIPTSSIKGDVGLSPSARSKIAGLTPVEVIGSIFAADDGGAVAVMLTQAKGDLTTAYNDAAGRTLAPVDIANADLGGRTLAPGLYKSTGTLNITGDLTLDGQGDPNAVFIFQIASTLITAAGSKVILIGSANADNIFWQVGTSAALATTTAFQGTILADQSISLSTGATLQGRAMASIGAVTLDANAITVPSAQVASVTLVSSTQVAGVYTRAAGQSLNLSNRTFTVPVLGNTVFYQVSAPTAVTISGIAVAGGNAVINYN